MPRIPTEQPASYRAPDPDTPSAVRISRARFILLNPDANHLTRDIMPLGKGVQALPGNELLRDLPLAAAGRGTAREAKWSPERLATTNSE